MTIHRIPRLRGCVKREPFSERADRKENLLWRFLEKEPGCAANTTPGGRLKNLI
jgi:hypothetical protein